VNQQNVAPLFYSLRDSVD